MRYRIMSALVIGAAIVSLFSANPQAGEPAPIREAREELADVKAQMDGLISTVTLDIAIQRMIDLTVEARDLVEIAAGEIFLFGWAEEEVMSTMLDLQEKIIDALYEQYLSLNAISDFAMAQEEMLLQFDEAALVIEDLVYSGEVGRIRGRRMLRSLATVRRSMDEVSEAMLELETVLGYIGETLEEALAAFEDFAFTEDDFVEMDMILGEAQMLLVRASYIKQDILYWLRFVDATLTRIDRSLRAEERLNRRRGQRSWGWRWGASTESIQSSTEPRPKIAVIPTVDNPNALMIRLAGEGVKSVQLRIFNLAGKLILYEQAAGGANELTFPLLDNGGNPLANGVYLCVVFVERLDGSMIEGEVQKLSILR